MPIDVPRYHGFRGISARKTEDVLLHRAASPIMPKKDPMIPMSNLNGLGDKAGRRRLHSVIDLRTCRTAVNGSARMHRV